MALLPAGCAGGLVPPTAEVQDVQLASLTFPTETARVLLCITNPNARPLSAKGVSFRIAVNGQDAVDATSEAAVALPPGQPVLVPFDAAIGGVGMLAAVGSAFRTGTLHYEISGKVDGAGLFGMDVPFAHSGDVTLLGAGLDVAAHPPGAPTRCDAASG